MTEIETVQARREIFTVFISGVVIEEQQKAKQKAVDYADRLKPEGALPAAGGRSRLEDCAQISEMPTCAKGVMLPKP